MAGLKALAAAGAAAAETGAGSGSAAGVDAGAAPIAALGAAGSGRRQSMSRTRPDARAPPAPSVALRSPGASGRSAAAIVSAAAARAVSVAKTGVAPSAAMPISAARGTGRIISRELHRCAAQDGVIGATSACRAGEQRPAPWRGRSGVVWLSRAVAARASRRRRRPRRGTATRPHGRQSRARPRADAHRRRRYGGIGACQLQAHLACLHMPRDRVVWHRRLQRRQRVRQGVLLRHETEQQDRGSAEPGDGGALATCRLHAAMLADSRHGAGDFCPTVLMARAATPSSAAHVRSVMANLLPRMSLLGRGLGCRWLGRIAPNWHSHRTRYICRPPSRRPVYKQSLGSCNQSAHVSALRPAIDSLLHTLPCSAVVFHRREQIFLVGPGAPCRVDQAIQIGANGFDAALEVADPRVEPMKQDGTLQFGRLERALFDGAHEDSRTAITEYLDAELAAPPGQPLRWRDVGQFRIYLQGGRVPTRPDFYRLHGGF